MCLSSICDCFSPRESRKKQIDRGLDTRKCPLALPLLPIRAAAACLKHRQDAHVSCNSRASAYKAKRKVNASEVNSYAFEDSKEAIIPEEMFHRVQEECSHRSNIEVNIGNGDTSALCID